MTIQGEGSTAEIALIVGEALVDVISENGSRTESPGGSPANVAFGLARLDRDAHFVSSIGSDRLSGLLVDHLAAPGVILTPGTVHEGPASVADVTLNADRSANYVFTIDWRIDTSRLPAAPLVVHTGSIAAFLAPGADQTLALLTNYADRATITFDPNIRPDLVGTRDEAVARVEQYLRIADVVKASDEDLEWLYPGVDALESARRWQSAADGPAIVVVTRGPEGAVAFFGDGKTASVAPITTVVVDTVGAGDAFMSGLIDALWQEGLLGAASRPLLAEAGDEQIGRMLHHCALSSGITVAQSGAKPPVRAALPLYRV